MRRLAPLAPALLALVLAQPSPAQQSCGRMVEELATRADLDAGVPVVRGTESGPELTDKLAQSGGVVAPPLGSGGSTPTITPPPEGPNTMPTAPPIEPQAGALGGSRSPSAEASVKMQAEAMLSSARLAAQRGDEMECRRNLEQAAALLGR